MAIAMAGGWVEGSEMPIIQEQKEPTQHDLDRLAKAEEKRLRRQRKRVANV